MLTSRWLTARDAAAYCGYHSAKALWQATYRVPALRACVVCTGASTRRGLRFDRERLDAYLTDRQPTTIHLHHLEASMRPRRRVA